MIKLILQFFAILPLRLNHALGALIGRLLYAFNTETKRVVVKNLELCFPEMTQQDRAKLAKQSLMETGKALTESSYIWLRDFDKNQQKVVSINGLEALEGEQPTILLVPHFGCWEITGRVLSLTKPVTFLYKPLKNQAQEQWLFANRQQGNLSMASADKKGVIKLQRALSKGELIGILPDQFPGQDSGVIVPFFNQDAYTMTLLAKLARKNKAKVILTWAYRLPKGQGFELNFEAVNISSDSGELKEDLLLMNQVVESLARRAPEQYLWNYKRFKYLADYN